MEFEEKEYYRLYDLEKIIAYLRSDKGCPWDREQTHESIRRNFLEESYEVCEAIDEKDPKHLCEELGDVLMQVVFHAGIEQDMGHFCLDDVADMVCKKLVQRHPHVFGNVKADTSEKVLDNWDAIKMKERSQSSVSDTMDSVAKSLPALWRADKIISKAAKAGFELDKQTAAENVKSAAASLSASVESGKDTDKAIGKLLFAAAALAHATGDDPEYALTWANDSFIENFRRAEKITSDEGLSVADILKSDIDSLLDETERN